MSVSLAILESADGQKWEDALLEAKSPKAKQFVARTRNELELLMAFALHNKMLNFREMSSIAVKSINLNVLYFLLYDRMNPNGHLF